MLFQWQCTFSVICIWHFKDGGYLYKMMSLYLSKYIM